MSKPNAITLRSVLSGKRKSPPASDPVQTQPQAAPNLVLTYNWHCLVLGATGTGKTTLLRELVRNTNGEMIWVGGAHPELATLKQVIVRQERFEEPVLVVVDDIHLNTEHLELIELVARDGLRSNVQLLISAQMIEDVPQAVWRNCQAIFALGESALQQLGWPIESATEFQAVFKWPSQQGSHQILPPNKPANLASAETGNPLLRRASTPQLAPYEESAPTRQTPLDQWSMEVPAEPLGLRDHPHDSRDLPRRTRYSRTL